MTARIFVDTNVFVYALDDSEAEKQRLCRAWVDALWQSRSARTSFQVLQELYATVIRKLSPPLQIADARQLVADLLAWEPLPNNERTLRDAWGLQDRVKLSWWDATIVASALQQSCDYLLSEDLQSGRTIDGMTILNPVTVTPGEIL